MSEEIKNRIPACMNDRFSTKSITIASLDGIIKLAKETDPSNDYQILLLTALGFIKGDICDVATDDNFITKRESLNSYKMDISYAIKQRNRSIDSLEEENPNIKPIDNGATLNLKNVTVYKEDFNNPILSIDQMLIFADQIISFSMISRNHN
jgi:hypothetical protein